MAQTAHTGSKHRFFEVDGLKGLAIFAILIHHCITHFNFYDTPVHSRSAFVKSDLLISHFSDAVLFGKIYLIFSLLFGFTFFLQIERLKAKGIYNTRKTVIRVLLLFVFGAINSLFFPNGDILVLYGLMGLLLIPLSRLNTRVLLLIAVVLLLQPFQLYYIFRLTISSGYSLPPVYSDVLKQQIITTMKTGSFWQIAFTNITKGQLASLAWSFESGRATQIMGMFLCGVIAGRQHILEKHQYQRSFWIKLFVMASLLFFAIRFLEQHIIKATGTEALRYMITLIFSLWQNLFFAFALIAAFITLYNTSFKKVLYPFTYLGKMSLTNYIFQSVIGALIFLPIGLNLADKLNVTYSFLLSFTIGLLLLSFSKNWLAKYKSGPLEALWARLSSVKNLKFI